MKGVWTDQTNLANKEAQAVESRSYLPHHRSEQKFGSFKASFVIASQWREGFLLDTVLIVSTNSGRHHGHTTI